MVYLSQVKATED